MSLTIEPRRFDDPDAVRLVEAIQQLYVELYGGTDRDRTDPDQFAPPGGLFLICYLDGVAVGCGGWRRHDAQTAEIKRMYVATDVRRRGVARQLLAELEATAAAAGVARMVLNTGYRQPDALAFYESCGYAPSDERFGHYEHITRAHFFIKRL